MDLLKILKELPKIHMKQVEQSTSLMDKLFLNIRPTYNEWLDISKAEKKYNAKFICEMQIKNTNDDWTDTPAYIFYQENPPNGYKNYFGIFRRVMVHTCDTLITSCDFAMADPLVGIYDSETGEVIHSRARHDFRKLLDGSFIDGGRDYLRTGNGDSNQLNFVNITFDKDKPVFEIITK